MNFIQISKQEYSDFYNNHSKKNFWQSLEMADFKELQGWKVHYVGIQEDDQILACSMLVSLPVFLKYSLFIGLRGFLIDYNDTSLVPYFLSGLKKYLHSNHCLYCKIDPYIPYQKHDKDGRVYENTKRRDDLIAIFQKEQFHHLGFTVGSDNTREPRWISILDLKDKTKAQILNEMDAQTRQNIKNTIKTGIKIRELDYSEFDLLQKIINETGERRHFLNPELSYYQSFHNAFKDDMKALYAYLDTDDYYLRYQKEVEQLQIELEHIEELIQESNTRKNQNKKDNCLKKIEAASKRMQEALSLKETYGKEISLGAAMFVITPYEIVYLFSGSVKQFNRFKGAYAIQWFMIEYALSHSIQRYNFYGISGIFDSNDEEYGVYIFKKGFNADVVELIGEFEYIDRKLLYHIYTSLRNMKHALTKKRN